MVVEVYRIEPLLRIVWCVECDLGYSSGFDVDVQAVPIEPQRLEEVVRIEERTENFFLCDLDTNYDEIVVGVCADVLFQ